MEFYFNSLVGYCHLCLSSSPELHRSWTPVLTHPTRESPLQEHHHELLQHSNFTKWASPTPLQKPGQKVIRCSRQHQCRKSCGGHMASTRAPSSPPTTTTINTLVNHINHSGAAAARVTMAHMAMPYPLPTQQPLMVTVTRIMVTVTRIIYTTELGNLCGNKLHFQKLERLNHLAKYLATASLDQGNNF